MFGCDICSLAVWLSDCHWLSATVLDSIPASSDTVEYEGRQMKQCWIKYFNKYRSLHSVSFSPIYCSNTWTLLIKHTTTSLLYPWNKNSFLYRTEAEHAEPAGTSRHQDRRTLRGEPLPPGGHALSGRGHAHSSAPPTQQGASRREVFGAGYKGGGDFDAAGPTVQGGGDSSAPSSDDFPTEAHTQGKVENGHKVNVDFNYQYTPLILKVRQVCEAKHIIDQFEGSKNSRPS